MNTQQQYHTTHEFRPFGSGRDEIVSVLPDSEAIIEESEVKAVKILQAWVGGRSEEVDNGRYEFTIPLSDLRRDTPINDDVDDTWGIHATVGGHHLPDSLPPADQLPDRFSEWHGPFEVRIKQVRIGRPDDQQTLDTTADTERELPQYHEFGRGASMAEIEPTLPSEESLIAGSEAELLFIGQEWKNDYACDVPGGENTFTVPLADLHRPDRDGDGQWLISGSATSHYVADGLGQHENNDQRYRNWTDNGGDSERCYVVKLNSLTIDDDTAE